MTSVTAISRKKVASWALLKSQFTFSHLCEAVEVLQLRKKLDMDAVYDVHCMVLPRQQAIIESVAPVVEKWSTLLKHTDTPNLTTVASFLLSIPITNASAERVFSLMTARWTDQRNRSVQVKSNFGLSCKDFHAYALKGKGLLEAAHSSKKYRFRKNLNGTNLMSIGPPMSLTKCD